MLHKVMASSVLWLPLTLGIYIGAREAYRRAGKAPLLNPTLLTICSVCAFLVVFDVPYGNYFDSVSILHYLLGTAVVALAIPLHRNLQKLRGELRPIALVLVAGSLTSIVCGLVIAKALGASPSTLLSVAPKSATAAVSMEIAGVVGGIPAVTACLTIFTGIIGAVLGPYVLTWSGEGEYTGCCASLAMGLNAILTALLVPLIVAAMQIQR